VQARSEKFAGGYGRPVSGRFAVLVAIAATLSAMARPEDRYLGNALLVVVFAVLVATWESNGLSVPSYWWLLVVFCFQKYGAHWKYSDVPAGGLQSGRSTR
jgi:hypothetical protein